VMTKLLKSGAAKDIFPWQHCHLFPGCNQ